MIMHVMSTKELVVDLYMRGWLPLHLTPTLAYPTPTTDSLARAVRPNPTSSTHVHSTQLNASTIHTLHSMFLQHQSKGS
jgi:hypothetical protein